MPSSTSAAPVTESVVSNVAFPVSVVTVGQAMQYLLQPSGHRLAAQLFSLSQIGKHDLEDFPGIITIRAHLIGADEIH